MSILHLYNIFGARTERYPFEISVGLHRRGWEGAVACESIAEDCPAQDMPVTLIRRIHVEPTDDVNGQMDRLARRVEDPALARLLEGPVELVHGYFGPRILYAAPLLDRGVPGVISILGYDAGRLLRDPCWMARYRWAAERGAVFVTVSEYLRRILIDGGLEARHVRCIHTSLDIEQWPYRPGPGPDPPRFVYAGRLTAKKAPMELLEAVALLRQRGKRIGVTFLGGGELEGELRVRADELGLGDAAEILGPVPREALHAHFGGATAFVLPSVTAADGDVEGLPRALLEALASGLPCITTHHSGNPEPLPAQGRGFVIAEHDVEALAEAMARMAALDADSRRQLQDAGRGRVEAHFTMDGALDAYEALYRSLK